MRTLDDLVRSGKVRYIGASNLAAWHLMKSLGIPATKGREAFKTIQSYYSLAGRELEREIIPLLQGSGVGLIVWSPLGRWFPLRVSSRGRDQDEGAGGRSSTSRPWTRKKRFASSTCLPASRGRTTAALPGWPWLAALPARRDQRDHRGEEKGPAGRQPEVGELTLSP